MGCNHSNLSDNFIQNFTEKNGLLINEVLYECIAFTLQARAKCYISCNTRDMDLLKLSMYLMYALSILCFNGIACNINIGKNWQNGV